MKKAIFLLLLPLSANAYCQCTGVAATGTMKSKVFKACYDTVMVASKLNTVVADTLTATRIGIGPTPPTPTSYMTLAAGAVTANAAPFKYTAGTNNLIPEAGAKEFDGVNEFLSVSTTRYTIAKTLTNTATLDFASTIAGAVADLTITVTGAALNDVVAVGVPNGAVTATATYTAWVSATDIVTVRFSPKATEDPASATFRVSVIKY